MNAALDHVAPRVDGPVEDQRTTWPSSPLRLLVASLGNRMRDLPPTEEPAAARIAIPFVGDEAIWAGSRSPATANAAAYWLTPIKSDEKGTAEEVVQILVGEGHTYAFGDRTSGRKHLKPGDWIAFYATGTGVIAHARVTSVPARTPHPKLRHPELYPWTFQLDSVRLYPEAPVVLDAAMRSQLDPFQGRDPNQVWAWFVQATRRISQHDFELLVRQ